MNLVIEYIQLLGKQSFHTGIDLAGAWHSNIISVLDGKVVFAGVSGGYGNCVKIEHNYKDETIYTLYAHLAEIKVYEGQEVKQGNIMTFCTSTISLFTPNFILPGWISINNIIFIICIINIYFHELPPP